MSLTLKITSLAIRTLAKPIATYIKRNAHEHERFRKFAINFAQRLHRVDMRLRLGLLQDAATIEKQIARELAEAEARRKKAAVPTVKTEAQAKREEDLTSKEKKAIQDSAKALPRIRPLSEAKAIETGANFISEAFLFCVAGGAIIFEYWRNRRKESNIREDLFDRLDQLEKERDDLKSKVEHIETALEAKETTDVTQRMPSAKTTSVASATKPGKTRHFEGGLSKDVPDEAKQAKP